DEGAVGEGGAVGGRATAADKAAKSAAAELACLLADPTDRLPVERADGAAQGIEDVDLQTAAGCLRELSIRRPRHEPAQLLCFRHASSRSACRTTSRPPPLPLCTPPVVIYPGEPDLKRSRLVPGRAPPAPAPGPGRARSRGAPRRGSRLRRAGRS